MKMKQYIIKVVCPSSSGSLLAGHCSGAFLSEITRAVLLTIVLGMTVVLATGCSSTGAGFSAKLISPMPTNQQASNSEGEGSHQPAESPAFSDYFGS